MSVKLAALIDELIRCSYSIAVAGGCDTVNPTGWRCTVSKLAFLFQREFAATAVRRTLLARGRSFSGVLSAHQCVPLVRAPCSPQNGFKVNAAYKKVTEDDRLALPEHVVRYRLYRYDTN